MLQARGPYSPSDNVRLRFWRLGQVNRARALKRVGLPPTNEHPNTLCARLATLQVPWTIEEYPGLTRFLSALLGITRETARNWYRGRTEVSRARLGWIAEFATQRAAEWSALADDAAAELALRDERERAPRGWERTRTKRKIG